MAEDGPDPITIVTDYIEASQRARETREQADFDAVRDYFHPDATIRLASAWGHDPWRDSFHSAAEIVERLQAPINSSTSLTTENVNVVRAGDDVLVEQLSTLHVEGRHHVSMVCHLFTVTDGRIAGIRTYRNDLGLPPG